jgi:hypothetical protein
MTLWPTSYEEALVRLMLAFLVVWIGGSVSIWILRAVSQPAESTVPDRVDLYPVPLDGAVTYELEPVPIVPGNRPRRGGP